MADFTQALLNQYILACIYKNKKGECIIETNLKVTGRYKLNLPAFLPLDEAVASTAVMFIVSGSNGLAGGWAETLLDPVK